MIEHPVPFIEVNPEGDVLGRYLGRIEFQHGHMMCSPLFNTGGHVLGLSELPSFPQFPNFGIVSEKYSQFSLRAMTTDLIVPELLDEQIFIELNGNKAAALMTMSNIACKTLTLVISRVVGKVHTAACKDGKKTEYWGPIEVDDLRDHHKVPIYVTVPENVGENAAPFVENVIKFRDYAYSEVIKAMSGIMRSNIMKTTKW